MLFKQKMLNILIDRIGCVSLRKKRHCPCVHSFSSQCFVCMLANQLDNLEFKTARLKDTKLTPAVIPLQVGVNNSLIFLALQICEKQFAKFPFLQDLYFLKSTKELYILTGIETRQLFRRMFVTLKNFNELFCDCQCQFGVFNFSRFERLIARWTVAHANTKRRRQPNKYGHCRVFPM